MGSADFAGSAEGAALRLESELSSGSPPWLGELLPNPLEKSNMSPDYGKLRTIASKFSKKSNRKRFMNGRISNKANKFGGLYEESNKKL